MSELTTNDRYSFDSMSAGRLPTQNVTLPKSQPVRLKALLQSDDEEDDDDESEEKPHQSGDESDFEEPLPQDDPAEDVLQETLVLKKAGIDSSSIELTDGVLKTACILSKENREVVTSTPSIQRERSIATDKEQCKVNEVNFERHISDIPVSELNKVETYSSKQEEKTQEYHSGTFTLKSQANTVHNYSTNVALLPPSLSVYKGDYNTKFDTNKNPQLIVNSNQLHHENAYMSDILNKRKEGSVYSTPAENKILLTRSNELNLSKDDQRYKGTYSFNEQTNKDCEEDTYKIPNVLSESAPCISQTSENVMHLVRHGPQKNVTRYEANEKYTPAKNTCAEFSTPSLNETGKLLATNNRLVSETPLKHVQTNVHPSPCTSHKQLFQTPQNKLSGGPSKSHVQTPSTTSSNWYHGNVRHTPMEGKSFVARDHVQMSKNAIRTPIVEKPDSSRFEVYYFTIVHYK